MQVTRAPFCYGSHTRGTIPRKSALFPRSRDRSPRKNANLGVHENHDRYRRLVCRRPTASCVPWRRPRNGSAASVTSPYADPPRLSQHCCPTYPEIRLSLLAAAKSSWNTASPSFSAGPAYRDRGAAWARGANAYCLRRNLRFTTSYHTQFPQYLRGALSPFPSRFPTGLHRFHVAAARCMVSTLSLRTELQGRGFKNLAAWRPRRGTPSCSSRSEGFLEHASPHRRLRRPGSRWRRMSRRFCGCRGTAAKIVIGDGPERARLQAQYPDTKFTGFRFAEDLGRPPGGG